MLGVAYLDLVVREHVAKKEAGEKEALCESDNRKPKNFQTSSSFKASNEAFVLCRQNDTRTRCFGRYFDILSHSFLTLFV